MAGTGRFGEAKSLLDRAAAANPDWAGYLRRLPSAGMIPDMPQVFDALLPLPSD
jgi:hypothetical protein